MTYRDLLIKGQRYFQNLDYDFSQKLLIYLLNCSVEELFLILDDEISIKPQKYFSLIESHLEGKPLAYIVNEQAFCQRNFFVNKHTLIPRNETEQLVENVLKILQTPKFFEKSLKILDLCTGSGVIGITLALELYKSQVIASDISNKALKIAKKNAKKLQCKNIIFQKSNLLKFFLKKSKKFDVVVCNPPYISKNEPISNSVKKYEPHLALFSDDNDGTHFYRLIFSQIKTILNNNALLVFEIGFQQKEILEPLVNFYFSEMKYEFCLDISNNYRMLFIYYETN